MVQILEHELGQKVTDNGLRSEATGVMLSLALNWQIG